MQPNSRFEFKPYPFSQLHEGYLTTGYYSCNYRIALQLFYYDTECHAYFPFATLTVNLPDEPTTDNHCVYIDTNNCPFALSLLVDVLHCAEFTGHVAQSGRCYYSEVRLIPDELYKYIPSAEVI